MHLKWKLLFQTMLLIGVGVFLLSGDDDLMYFLMVNYVVGDDNSVLLDGDFFLINLMFS